MKLAVLSMFYPATIDHYMADDLTLFKPEFFFFHWCSLYCYFHELQKGSCRFVCWHGGRPFVCWSEAAKIDQSISTRFGDMGPKYSINNWKQVTDVDVILTSDGSHKRFCGFSICNPILKKTLANPTALAIARHGNSTYLKSGTVSRNLLKHGRSHGSRLMFLDILAAWTSHLRPKSWFVFRSPAKSQLFYYWA